MGYYIYYRALEDIYSDTTPKKVILKKGKVAEWEKSNGIKLNSKNIEYKTIHSPATLQDVANAFGITIEEIEE